MSQLFSGKDTLLFASKHAEGMSLCYDSGLYLRFQII